MASTTSLLPDGFGDLEKYVPEWSFDDEADRKEKRASAEMADLEDYYRSLLGRVEEIAAYLDGVPMGALPPQEKALLNLALMFMDVSIAVEFYKQPDLPGSFPRHRFKIETPISA